MKKRLLCLLLTLVMVLTCLASCGEKDDEEAVENIQEEASESAITLSMYLLAENLPEDETERNAQIAAIEAAANKITKSKFKTQLDLRIFATEEEYYAALDAAYAARAEAEAAGNITAPAEGDETKEDETYADDLGVMQIKYPTIADYQVDILYLGGYANFNKYVTEEKLQSLDTELDSASKKLKEYISTPYLKYMKSVNNGTYAIPTNSSIGEYTYLLLDKNVLSELYYDTDEGISTIGTNIAGESFAKYLSEVKSQASVLNAGEENEQKYVPFASNLTNTELAALCYAERWHIGTDGQSVISTNDNIHYFGVDANGQYTPNRFSLFAGSSASNASFGNKNSWMDDTGASADIIKQRLNTIINYRSGGYLVEVPEGQRAAVQCVKGSEADRAAYEADGYEVVVIGKPTLVNADIYENMFGVASFTSSVSRSMEIITYLYTNEDFHNLLMYGVENEDYELVPSEKQLDEEGEPLMIVKDLNANYGIAAEKLGNTLIGHYSDTDTPAYRESIMKQNNSSTVDILMGFTYGSNVAADDIAKMAELSAAAEALINAYTIDPTDTKPLDTFETWWGENITPLTSQLAMLAVEEEPENGGTTGLRGAYKMWAQEKSVYVEPVEASI